MINNYSPWPLLEGIPWAGPCGGGFHLNVLIIKGQCLAFMDTNASFVLKAIEILFLFFFFP